MIAVSNTADYVVKKQRKRNESKYLKQQSACRLTLISNKLEQARSEQRTVLHATEPVVRKLLVVHDPNTDPLHR
jgi:hypothetical protein